MDKNKLKLSIAKRLAKYSSRNDSSGCLEWHGYKDVYGYGVLLVSTDGIQKNKKAHRLSYEQKYGEIEVGKLVCHRCDVRNCIEPTHLYLGTAADNNKDMMLKGRYRSGKQNNNGEKNPNAKLTIKQVDSIKVLFQYGITQKQIANSLSLHRSTIQRIASGKNWLRHG
jgi:hypothetical protein